MGNARRDSPVGSGVGAWGLLNITTEQPGTSSTMQVLSHITFSSGSLGFHSTESATFSALVKASSELNRKKSSEAKPLKAETTVAYI